MNFEFTITEGQTSATIPVPIINDGAFELTESFSAALSLVSPLTPRITIAEDEASITIEDDDSEFHERFCVMTRVTKCYYFKTVS